MGIEFEWKIHKSRSLKIKVFEKRLKLKRVKKENLMGTEQKMEQEEPSRDVGDFVPDLLWFLKLTNGSCFDYVPHSIC
jgi:hypothetical protein